MEQARPPSRVLLFTVAEDVVVGVQQILEARGDRLVGVLTAPGPRTRQTDEYRSIASHARPGIDVIISNYPNRWAEMIRPLRPDVIACMGFNWRIPQEVLDIPRLGAINGHDALLPRNRGRNATGWALRTGEPVYGVTVHRMTAELDDGPILSQRSIVIGDDEDIDDVFPRFTLAAIETISEALDLLIEGTPGIPQNEAEATWSPGRFEPEWREIDWNRPVRDVFFQIRSWYGVRDVPRGAFGEIDGQRLLITKAKPACDVEPATGASPGDVLARDDNEILVQCADGPLRVLSWEPAEDAERTGQLR